MHSDSPGSSRHLVTYRDGEHIFTQGEKGEEMYIIQDGQVEIVLEREDGEVALLATLERGDFFGEMAVLEGVPRTATARAKGSCSVLPLRGTLFVEMLQRDPETTLRIMRKLCGRIRELQSRLRERADGPISFIGEAAPARTEEAPAAKTIGARLVHATGAALDLPDVSEASVGRPDPSVGSVPEIDLSRLEEGRTVSRSHARILHRDGHLYVVAEAGTNGTYLEGKRLEPGVPSALRAGDSVTFGKVTLRLEMG